MSAFEPLEQRRVLAVSASADALAYSGYDPGLLVGVSELGDQAYAQVYGGGALIQVADNPAFTAPVLSGTAAQNVYVWDTSGFVDTAEIPPSSGGSGYLGGGNGTFSFYPDKGYAAYLGGSSAGTVGNSKAEIRATVTSGVVTKVTIIDGGLGYFVPKFPSTSFTVSIPGFGGGTGASCKYTVFNAGSASQKFQLSSGDDLKFDLSVGTAGDRTGMPGVEGIKVSTAVTGNTTIFGADNVSTDAILSSNVQIKADNAINIAAPINSDSLDIRSASADLTLAADVSSKSSIYLSTQGGNLVVNGKINAATSAFLIAPAGTFNGTALGSGITATNLAIDDGGTGGNLSLGTNVSNLTGTTKSNLTLTNAKALRLGPGTFTSVTGGSGFLTLQTTSGDINVNANLTSDANISLKSAGNIDFTSTITAPNRTVFMNAAAGNIGGTGQVITGVGASAANGGINLAANGDIAIVAQTGYVDAKSTTGNITVNDSDGMTLGNLSSPTSGNIVINAAAGDIVVNGTVTTSTSRSLTLNAPLGNIVQNGSLPVTTGLLAFTSLNQSALLNTASYTCLAVNITGAGNDANIAATRSFTVQGVTTASGNVALNLTNNANLTLAGSITAGAGSNKDVAINVSTGSINGSGIVNAANLDVRSLNNASLVTNVSNLTANVTGSGKTLTILESSNLTIAPGNLTTNNGSIDVTVSLGNLTLANAINAGSGGNVALRTPDGSINGSASITGNVLNVATNLSSNLNTSVQTFVGTLAQPLQTLEVREKDDLIIGAAGIVAANSDVKVTLGNPGNLTISGNINAGTLGNITLDASNGGITGNGVVYGQILNVSTNQSLSMTTQVSNLVANVSKSGANQNLTIVQTGNLAIDSGNVYSNNGSVNLTIAGGSLTGTGQINAGTGGNVSLNVAGGGIVLNAANAIVGNILNITSLNAVNLKTSIATIIAKVAGSGQDLTVTEADDLSIGTNVTTNGGNVTLSAGGGISGNGTIVGNILDVTAANTSTLTTNITTLIANITSAGQNLTVTEADDLSIGTNVTTNGGNVTLTAGGGISGNGTIVGNILNVTATNTTTLTTNITTLVAKITGAGQNLTITEADNLSIGTNVTTNGGNVTLSAGGGISGPGTIAGNVLNVTATNTTTLTTNVTTLIANITGAGQGLTVAEADNLTIGSNVTTSGGNVTLSAGGGISGNGTIAGNVLDVTAANTSTLTTNITTLVANITGAGQDLTVNEADNLAIGSNVTTNGGNLALNVSNGQITGNGSLTAANLSWTALQQPADQSNWTYSGLTANVTGAGNTLTVLRTDKGDLDVFGLTTKSGPINVVLDGAFSGNLTLKGPVTAGGTDNVTLLVANGAVSGVGLISGNVLDLTARDSSLLTTNITALAANITNPLGGSLVVSEQTGLTIPLGKVVKTADGSITLDIGTSGTSNSPGPYNFTLDGDITAGSGSNLTINVPFGSISGLGNLMAGNLSWTAIQQPANESNWIYTGLTANVTGAGNGLNVTRTNAGGLTVYGLTTDSGPINVLLNGTSSGSLSLSGNVTAGSGQNVTLTVTNGAVLGTGLITANVLNVSAVNDTTLNTNITTLVAKLTGLGQGLTVTEADNLAIGSNVTTNGGNITLTAGGGIGGNGTLAGDVLNVTAGNSSTLTTNVTTLIAKITGPGQNLTVTEADDLLIGPNVTTNGGNVTLTAGGSINGTGTIAGNVLNVSAVNATTLTTNITTLVAKITGTGQSLTVTEADNLTIGPNVTTNNGNVTLSSGGGISGPGTITGNVLNVTAANSSTLTTNITTLVATITGAAQSLTVTEADNLSIGSNVTTNNGNVTLSAGGGISGPGTITGNVLNVTAANSSTLTTNIATLVANITKAGQNLTVTEADNLVIGSNVTTNNGNVSLNVGGGITGSGIITGNVLTLQSTNSAFVQTNVSDLAANVTGVGQSLVVSEQNALRINSISAAYATVVVAGNLTQNGPVKATTLSVTATAGTVTLDNGTNDVDALSIVNGNRDVTFRDANGFSVGVGPQGIVGGGINLFVAGNLTQTQSIRGTTLAVTATAGSVLFDTVPVNDVASLAISNPNRVVRYADVNDLSVASLTGGDMALGVGGNLSQTGPIVGASLSVGTKLVGTTVSGDFNGDGIQDLAGLGTDGRWWVGLGNNANTSLDFQVFGSWSPSANWQNVMAGDINGDGKDDIVGRTPAGAWWGAISNGSSFSNSYLGAWADPASWVNVMIGDLTGDGKDDVYGRSAVTGQWLAGISSGTAFTNRVMGAWDPSVTWLDVMTGDFNGDGKADVVGRTSTGVWWAGITNPTGTAFDNRSMGVWSTSTSWLDVMVGDYNGDGRDDVLGRSGSGGQWWAGITNVAGTAFTNRLMGRWNPTTNWTNVRTGDFDNNGLDDIAGQADYGVWWGGISNGTTFTNQLQTWATSPAWGTGMAFNQSGRTTTAVGVFNGTIVLPNASNNLDRISLDSRGRTVVYNDLDGTSIGVGTTGINAGQVILSAGGPLSQSKPIIGTSLSVVSTAGDVTLGNAGNKFGLLAANVLGAGAPFTLVHDGTLAISQVSTQGLVTISTGSGGDLRIGPAATPTPLLQTTTAVNLAGVTGKVILENGGRIVAPGGITLPPGGSLQWTVSNSNDSGVGSFRQVLTDINATGLPATVTITTPTTVNLLSPLPVVAAPLTLLGNGLFTLNGAAAGAADGLVLGSAASQSSLSGTTLQNFTGAGVNLVGTQNTTVTGITVSNSNFGVLASGALAGTGVYSSTFTGNIEGLTMSGAQNLAFGRVGGGNTITGTAGRSTRGIVALGANTGTIVKANTISGAPQGISINASTGITFGGLAAGEGNSVSFATTGVFATGSCSGSSVIKTTFPSGVVTQYDVSTSRNLTVVQ